jgi:prepilin signal peptidase PulO-like enzyme (type II secretory pathway)
MLNSIAEFSRCHCIGICAVLVPTNLFLAIATLWFVAADRSSRRVYTTVSLSILPATIMLLHVASWWAIGVVMLPTFILPLLAVTCLAINIYAIVNPRQMQNLLLNIFKFSLAKYQQLVTN